MSTGIIDRQFETDKFVPADPPISRYPLGLDINSIMISVARVIGLLDPQLVFAPAYPDFVTNVEGKDFPSPTVPDRVITWKVIRREPGSLTGHPFQNTIREVAARVREQRADPSWDVRRQDEAHAAFEYSSQQFDNLVQFDCWSKTNKQVVDLLEWFENFLHEFRKLFNDLGVQNYYFWERAEDIILFQYRNGLQFRSTRYFFRTQVVRETRLHLIEEIRHRLAVLGSTERDSQIIN